LILNYLFYLAIKYYRAAMQLVPDIEFRMARKAQQQITTMDPNNRQYEMGLFCLCKLLFFNIENMSMMIKM
jgi:hypothetical protein